MSLRLRSLPPSPPRAVIFRRWLSLLVICVPWWQLVLVCLQPPISARPRLQQANWLEELCAWLRCHKRRPYHFEERVGLNETEVEERLQYRRCAEARKLHRKNKLSQSQLGMLQPFENEIGLRRLHGLQGLLAWTQHHKRRPRSMQTKVGLNETELEEQLQYRRWAKVRSLYRKNQLTQKQRDMLQPLWNEILLDDSCAELKRTTCVEKLCAWLRVPSADRADYEQWPS